MKRGKEFRATLGETLVLKGNFVEKRMRLAYCGQYLPGRYSIAIIISYGNNSYAYNLYFGSDQKNIAVPYGKIMILETSEDSIYFIYKPD